MLTHVTGSPGDRFTWWQVHLGTGSPGDRFTWGQVHLGTGRVSAPVLFNFSFGKSLPRCQRPAWLRCVPHAPPPRLVRTNLDSFRWCCFHLRIPNMPSSKRRTDKLTWWQQLNNLKHVHVHVYALACTGVCAHLVWKHVCACFRAHAHVCVWVRVCACMYVRAYVHVYMCVAECKPGKIQCDDVIGNDVTTRRVALVAP